MFKTRFTALYAAIAVALMMTSIGAHAAGSPDPGWPEDLAEFQTPFDSLTPIPVTSPSGDPDQWAPRDTFETAKAGTYWYGSKQLRLADKGTVSPKDQCHKHAVTKERHWHSDEAGTIGGPCIKADGETFHFGGNSLCADERIAMDRDSDSWYPDWKTHAHALLACIKGLDTG